MSMEPTTVRYNIKGSFRYLDTHIYICMCVTTKSTHGFYIFNRGVGGENGDFQNMYLVICTKNEKKNG